MERISHGFLGKFKTYEIPVPKVEKKTTEERFAALMESMKPWEMDPNKLVRLGGYVPTSTPVPPTPTNDPDYQAVLDYATLQGYTLPSSSGQTLQNNLVVSLKSAGIWEELDIFYVMATDGDSNFSKLNFKDATNFKLLENGTMSFVSNEGFSRSQGSYLQTQYNCATDAINCSLTSTSHFVWDFNNLLGISRAAYCGHYSPVGNDRLMGEITTSTQSVNSGVGTNLGIDMTGIGFKMAQRISNTLYYYNNSGTSFFNENTTSTGALVNTELIIGRDGSGAGHQSIMTISVFGRSSSLSGKETALYNAISTYMTSL